jgi:hypothetical protein
VKIRDAGWTRAESILALRQINLEQLNPCAGVAPTIHPCVSAGAKGGSSQLITKMGTYARARDRPGESPAKARGRKPAPRASPRQTGSHVV